jgi:CDGSH-type Zn-finger protein
MENEVSIKVAKGGPYIVDGKIKVVLPSGEEKEMTGKTALCRCGQSKNKPFCDGSHHNVDFDK